MRANYFSRTLQDDSHAAAAGAISLSRPFPRSTDDHVRGAGGVVLQLWFVLREGSARFSGRKLTDTQR